MGREVRRVPPDWQHPREADGSHRELWPGDCYREHLEEWTREAAAGDPSGMPHASEYMPEWPPEVATHWQLYEDTSKGTPKGPVCATAEEAWSWDDRRWARRGPSDQPKRA